jgi:hypothetical protein
MSGEPLSPRKDSDEPPSGKGSPPEQSTVEKHYIYHVNPATNQVLKIEEADPATGERKDAVIPPCYGSEYLGRGVGYPPPRPSFGGYGPDPYGYYGYSPSGSIVEYSPPPAPYPCVPPPCIVPFPGCIQGPPYRASWADVPPCWFPRCHQGPPYGATPWPDVPPCYPPCHTRCYHNPPYGVSPYVPPPCRHDPPYGATPCPDVPPPCRHDPPYGVSPYVPPPCRHDPPYR